MAARPQYCATSFEHRLTDARCYAAPLTRQWSKALRSPLRAWLFATDQTEELNRQTPVTTE